MRRNIRGIDHLVPDVRAQIRMLEEFLDNARDDIGTRPCDARCGIYAYYDFDGAPIYVGQTREQLRVRIRRHLTNKRTDAVAMKVLDPMEVAEIEVWPFWDLEDASTSTQKATLNAAEYSVFTMLNDTRGAISNLLNEVMPPITAITDLPQPYRAALVPPESRERLYHPDERIARRAATIAALAQIIKERDVSLGLRHTFITQAGRLLRLSERRMNEIVGDTPPAEVERELFGNEGDDARQE